jgi:hypothetical protein
MLLLAAAAILTQHIVVLLDIAEAGASIAATDALRQEMLALYDKNIARVGSNYSVAAVAFAGATAHTILTYTSLGTPDGALLVRNAIETIEFDTSASAVADWKLALDHVNTFSPLPKRAVLVSNENPPSNSGAVVASKALQSKGVAVYPLGVGPHVSNRWLQRVAGPCSSFFGCMNVFNYYHKM